MAARRRTEPDPTPRRRNPATTPEGRENQLISMAVDLAEDRIRAGTASAQEIVHFLKLGSSRERLEQQKLEQENQLLAARAEAIASTAGVEKLYKDAIRAMRKYSGYSSPEDDDEDED